MVLYIKFFYVFYILRSSSLYRDLQSCQRETQNLGSGIKSV